MPLLNNKQMAQALGISVNRLGYYRRNKTLIRESDGTWDRDKTIRSYNANVDVQVRSVKGYGAGRPKKNRSAGPQEPPSYRPPVPSPKVLLADSLTDDSGGPIDPDDPQGATLISARIRKTLVEAQQKELDFRLKCGDLVRVDDVRKVWSRQISAVKSALLLLPAKISSKLAIETDILRVQAVLDESLRQILQELSEYSPESAEKADGDE